MTEESDNGAEWQGDHDMFSDPEEQKHLFSVLDSFRQYRRAAHFNTTHTRRQNFYALPTHQWTLLSKPPFSLLDTFSKVDDAIDTNADLADAILETALASIGVPDSNGQGKSPTWKNTASKTDVDKARSTLNQLYRDWSSEGEVERAACYGPILRDLAEMLPPQDGHNIRILVPGAGLGRLVFELCREGYNVEGNEISYHQLLASSFILNHTTKEDEWPIHPWALSFSNNVSRADQLRKVMIPDICPQNVPCSGSMNMTTGDFCVLYREDEYKDTFDSVATAFFIDTAPNLINYVATVRHCLKPGGYWINLGPLLWHFWDRKPNNQENNGDHNSAHEMTQVSDDDHLGIAEPGAFELCEDEVIALLGELGFDVEKHDTESVPTGYVQNSRSMLRSVYHPSHWVAKKR